MSSPGNLSKGKTDSFNKNRGIYFFISAETFNLEPNMILVAIFAKGTPMDLLIKGTVLLALGLTSKT